jgi:hypothetical protein
MLATAPAAFVVVADNATFPMVCDADELVRKPLVLPVLTPSPAFVTTPEPSTVVCGPNPYRPLVYIESVP